MQGYYLKYGCYQNGTWYGELIDSNIPTVTAKTYLDLCKQLEIVLNENQIFFYGCIQENHI